MKQYDIIAIGGGVGGLIVTSVASQLGLSVALIEREPKLGGDCLHYGCVPSKSLIKSAKVAHLMRRGGDFGLSAHTPSVDLGQVTGRVQKIIDTIQVHDDPDRFRGYGADVFFGEASFVDPNTVDVKGERLRAKRFLIATGSRPVAPPVQGLAEAGFITNEQVFKLTELPKRLAVLGGGPIGIELAQAFHRLGAEVTVFEMAPQILIREDQDAAAELRRILEAEGLTIHTDAKVEKVEAGGGVKRVSASGPGGRIEFDADEILVAAGRAPNVESLNLEAAGVRYSKRGIDVDDRLRTSRKHIYAVGDVNGALPFTHVAEYQAGIVISNAIFRFPKKVDYRVVPWATYSDPELARVGVTEQEARDQGIDPIVMRFDFKDVDRALAESETDGFVKLIGHKGRLIGATILGPHGGELIHELVLAMQAKAKLSDISAAIHAYPTLSQVHRRAVNTHFGKALFSDRVKTVVKWINRLLP